MDFTISDILISSSSPALPYRRRKLEDKTRNKWGQLKLLMTEVQFFNLYWNPKEVPNPVIVYAGAASGIHIPYLSSLFPTFTFHLYDPAKFDIEETDKIFIYNEYFTDEVARKWSGRKDVFFISDIRTVGWEKPDLSEKDIEEGVWRDMCWQQTWHDIIRPVKSHLKFRLPYTLDNSITNVEYLYGYVFIQPWIGPSSTETRLVPYGHNRIVWDSVRYEQQNFYHNVIVRPSYGFKNPFTNTLIPIYNDQLLNDYDSRLTAQIVIDYLTRFSKCNYTNFKKWIDNSIQQLDWTKSGKSIATIRQDLLKIFINDTPQLQKAYIQYQKSYALVDLLRQNKIPYDSILYDLIIYNDRYDDILTKYLSLYPNLPMKGITIILNTPNMLKGDSRGVITTDASKDSSIQYRNTKFNVPVYFISDMKENNIPKDSQLPVYYRYFSFMNDFWKVNVNQKVKKLLDNYGVNTELFVSPFQKIYPKAYGYYPEDKLFGLEYEKIGTDFKLQSGPYLIHLHNSIYLENIIQWLNYQLENVPGLNFFILKKNDIDFGSYQKLDIVFEPGKYTLYDVYSHINTKPKTMTSFSIVSNLSSIWTESDKQIFINAFY